MDKIIHHVRKHHKKYILAAGAAAGLLIFKIMTVIAVFFGISFISGKSEAADVRTDIYKAVSIFNQIDDMAHQEIYAHIKEGHLSEEEKEEFKTIDAAFHKAQNLNEKYRTIKKIADFLTEHEVEETHAHTPEEIEREKKLEQLLEIFNQMQ